MTDLQFVYFFTLINFNYQIASSVIVYFQVAVALLEQLVPREPKGQPVHKEPVERQELPVPPAVLAKPAQQDRWVQPDQRVLPDQPGLRVQRVCLVPVDLLVPPVQPDPLDPRAKLVTPAHLAQPERQG